MHGAMQEIQNTTGQGFFDGEGFFDQLHANSVAWTPDGHVLVSLRHLSQIIKINRKTGAIMWKLGGIDSDFSFEGDDPGPSWQHDARLHAGGILTVFDNGSERRPPWSRAVEYELDQKKMVAKKIWEYRDNPDRFGVAMGGFDYLENGNLVVNFAGVEPDTNPFYTEVTRRGEKVLELSVEPGMAYRAMKYPWWGVPSTRPQLVMDEKNASLHFSWNGATHIHEWRVYGGLDPETRDLITSIPKKQFEHSILLAETPHSPVNSCLYYRVEAIDIEHRVNRTSATLLSPWCSSLGAMCLMDDAEKEDCAEDKPSLDAKECKSRGCCYRPPAASSKDGVPWCFRPRQRAPNGACASGRGRANASWKGIRREQCVAQGACWRETDEVGVPWCFHAGDTCRQTDTTRHRAIDCGYRGIHPKECISRGCCWSSEQESCSLPTADNAWSSRF